jgi:hypothetical protein
MQNPEVILVPQKPQDKNFGKKVEPKESGKKK